jgi:hypothetical protein
MSDWMLHHGWGIRGYRPTHGEKTRHQAEVVMPEPLEIRVARHIIRRFPW